MLVSCMDECINFLENLTTVHILFIKSYNLVKYNNYLAEHELPAILMGTNFADILFKLNNTMSD